MYGEVKYETTGFNRYNVKIVQVTCNLLDALKSGEDLYKQGIQRIEVLQTSPNVVDQPVMAVFSDETE